MANMSIRYNIEKHTVAFPSNILSAEYGSKHMYSIQLNDDCDNGWLVAAGQYLSLDLFEEAEVTAFEGEIVQQMGNGNWLVMVTSKTDDTDALLVYQVPVAAEEWGRVWTQESNYFNEAGSIVRAYGLSYHDRFEVSKEAFDGEPAVGAKITGVSNKKMVIG